MKNNLSVQSTILIVDDEIEMLEFVREEISPFFAKIILAANGLEATEVLKSNAVDLVVTDYAMPKMNGLKLIDFIKNNYPLIPVIMLTGNGSKPEVLEALEKGAFDILDKPFRTPVLVNRIQNGLLVPELIKTIWSYASKDLSLERKEEFLKKSPKEQFRIMKAYNAVTKMRAQLESEDEAI